MRDKKRQKHCHTKDTWQLKAMWYPGLDLETEKGNLNKSVV